MTCPAKLLTINGDVLCAERESHRGLHGGLMPNGGPFVQWPRLRADDVEIVEPSVPSWFDCLQNGTPRVTFTVNGKPIVVEADWHMELGLTRDPWLRLVSWCRANGIRVSV